MKKQRFLNELGKRFKYVGKIICNSYGFNNFKKYEIKIVIIEKLGFKVGDMVYEEMISFWVQNENKVNEKILDVHWKGLCRKFDIEIKDILKNSEVFYTVGIQ